MNRFCPSHHARRHYRHRPVLLALAFLLTTAFFVWLGSEQTALLLPLLGAVFALSNRSKTCTAGWCGTTAPFNTGSQSDPNDKSDTLR